MASNNAVSSTLPPRDFHCEVCDLYLDSVESLKVHVQYHKENLYVKWGSQGKMNAADNNNAGKVKCDTKTTVSAPADSSDNMIAKPSPEFPRRTTPETSSQFPHPATPQSYHSAPSPYQSADQTSFSPSGQYNNTTQYTPFAQNQHGEHSWDPSQYNQDYHKQTRFHPYGSVQDRLPQVTSSSPLYAQPLNQPTPSPSPNQCDKCGFVCDSAIQLTEHCNTAHNTPAQTSYQHMQQFTSKQYPGFSGSNDSKIKEEQEESSDILDLDSQKVVYPGTEGEQIVNSSFESSNGSHSRDTQRSMPSMVSWESQKIYSSAMNGDSALYKEQKNFVEQKSFVGDAKMFHPEQKFPFLQEKGFLSSHHDQKPFIHPEQKMFAGISALGVQHEYGTGNPTNPDMKPPYRPYDSTTPQISSTQPANPSSSSMTSMGGKGANWKSNEARRPKTYNCTACNKWFTSSGHLKRHYNTTLHKNAVRSSGQPDPASLPISNHHHPSRDQNRGPPPPDSNTHSPGSGDDVRSVEETMQSQYIAQSYERGHRASSANSLQSKSPYSHLQQGNIDSNFMSNNPLANHPLPHQVGTHPLNIGTQPPGLGTLNDSNHQGLKPSPTNPPNGEAGPSASQNHHMRGLLSVSANNISTPLPQSTTQITPHTLPPFSHLTVNPYSPRATDHLVPTVPDPTHTPLYLGQNFQQSIAQNYPNGMAPHVMDMAISNLRIASPVTFGELIIPEITEVMETETPNESSAPLPCFAQIQSQSFGILLPNYLPSPNVGGSASVSSDTYLILNTDNASNQQYDQTVNTEKVMNSIYEYDFSKSVKMEVPVNNNIIKMKNFEFVNIKADNNNDLSSDLNTIRIDDIIDYTNKENFDKQMKSPASPESAKIEYDRSNVEYESGGSPSVSSTVQGPLAESNKPKPLHKCYECDKFFNKACYLTQHNKTFHSGLRPFKCERCGKRFPDDASYEEHFSKHAGNKPFKCQECPKSFNHKTDLRRHMCIHTGKKPFACAECGKGFIRKDHMLKHCETHRKKNIRQISA